MRLLCSRNLGLWLGGRRGRTLHSGWKEGEREDAAARDRVDDEGTLNFLLWAAKIPADAACAGIRRDQAAGPARVPGVD